MGGNACVQFNYTLDELDMNSNSIIKPCRATTSIELGTRMRGRWGGRRNWGGRRVARSDSQIPRFASNCEPALIKVIRRRLVISSYMMSIIRRVVVLAEKSSQCCSVRRTPPRSRPVPLQDDAPVASGITQRLNSQILILRVQ